jgi:hypothetical protein
MNKFIGWSVNSLTVYILLDLFFIKIGSKKFCVIFCFLWMCLFIMWNVGCSRISMNFSDFYVTSTHIKVSWQLSSKLIGDGMNFIFICLHAKWDNCSVDQEKPNDVKIENAGKLASDDSSLVSLLGKDSTTFQSLVVLLSNHLLKNKSLFL